jgi:glycosyltransferase involved in cell wall biosynthesis
MLTAKKAVREMVEKYNIDAVYSSSPPYTCSLIARYAKRKYGLPWIAGFRDPWTGFISSPKRWFIPRAIDRWMEESVFLTADAVECAWKGIIKDALVKYPNIESGKFHHVPNGYDSADYPELSEEQKRPNDKFTVTYTGSMYGRRNPSSLFAALESLIKNGKLNQDEFTLKFIGRFGNEVHEMFEQASFRSSIEVINYMPHQESIVELMKSDLLLLVVDESKESEEIVPGKVYEYIGTGKPLMAIAPEESAIADLMMETKAGMLAHQSNIDKIEDIFMTYFNDWKNGTKSINPDFEVIRSYERRESAKKLAELLNGTIGRK